MSPAFVRPPTAQAAVLAELRERIGSGRLAPGAPIRQDQLADALGVSRHPIREALRVLEGEGQIIHEPHRGYFVARLDRRALVEIYRMRELLETEALRVAVPDLDDGVLSRVTSAHERMAELDPATDMADLVAANRAFHFPPMEAAGLPRLLHHVRLLWEASEAYRTLYYSQAANLLHVHEEHDAILKALHRRDVDAVVTRVRHHRDAAVERLEELLTDHPVD